MDKIFVEQPTPEPKVEAYVPMYDPLRFSKLKKCGEVISKPKELIRIQKKYQKTVNLFMSWNSEGI